MLLDPPALTVLVVVAIGLVMLFVVPALKQKHYTVTMARIRQLVEQLPVTHPDGQIELCDDAKFDLAEIQERHPQWVERGFALVLGDIINGLENARGRLNHIKSWSEAQRHEIRQRYDEVEMWQARFDVHQATNAAFHHFIAGRRDLKQSHAERV